MAKPKNKDKDTRVSSLNNNLHRVTGAATIFTLALTIMTGMMIAASSMTAIPAAASVMTTTTDNATTTAPQLVYQELRRPISNIPINETHLSVTYSGNGTLTQPDTGETINTTSDGTAIVAFMTQSTVGSETLRTEDGETATVTIHEIVTFDPAAMNGEPPKGIAIAVIHNVTGGGVLEPFDGMVLVGADEIQPNDDSHITFWEAQSMISLLPSSTTAPNIDGNTTTVEE